MDEKLVGKRVTPAEAMRLAIDEAKKGAGHVSPNPLVGCTIVDREHRVLAIGYHKRIGQDHAEIDALKKIADPSLLEGAHAYVTLEPCAHQGRTPSCARTLAPYKLGSVTYAVEDPNPLVAGKGAKILIEAGTPARLLRDREDIPVDEREDLCEQSEDLAEIFLHNMRAKEPFVSIKVASTLDGRMALTSGESKWITGAPARDHVHLLRARYDAVAIGRNTFVADDPSLNVRHANYPGFQNKAVVFDPKGRTLAAMKNSNLLKVRSAESIFVVVGEGQDLLNPSGVKIVSVPTLESGAFDMKMLLAALKSEGIHSLMVEGGAHTFGAFFQQEKVQRLHLFQAPSLLGGQYGIAWSAHFGVDKMAQKISVSRVERQVFGDDMYVSGRVRFSSNS